MEQESASILVVDDDDDIRELLYDRLEFMGHQVSMARNGREGLERIVSEQPDLVLLDVQMPELDGFGVLKGIAEKDLNTMVIMITANGTIQRAVQAMQEGASDFLLKPFQPKDVERRVNRALESVRLERENQRLQQELAEAQRRLIEDMRSELDIAHDMQMQLLPEHPPKVAGVDLAGMCLPAKQVGGDYYTFIPELGGNRLGIVVADVSGKGMQAATVAMRFNEMLRYEVQMQTSGEDILKGLDRALRGHIPPNMFVTCGIAELDVQKKILHFATAACPDVYHYRAETDSVQALGAQGFPLGLPFPLPADGFQAVEVALKTGDLVVFTSDGIEEARNEDDDFYGEDRLQKLILTLGQQLATAEEVRNGIAQDVMAFTGEIPQTDDLTIVVLRMV